MKRYIPYLFNKKELLKDFKSEKQLNNWIFNQTKLGKIKKIRNGLYVSIDQTGIINSTKFEIASKISPDSFVAFHSALEYYGIANQVFNNMVVGSSTKFNAFEFDGIEYNLKIIKNYEQVNYIESAKVRITSLERTIIDCIDNIELAGGIEEVLNALQQIKTLEEIKLLDVLKSYDKVLLYQKVGFILEQFKDELMLSDYFFCECKSHLTNQVKYFLQDEFKNIEYNSKWKIMAPINIKTRINGGS